MLARGVNITNWFRYPPSADPALQDAYLSDAAIIGLRTAGFTFVRLPVQPTFVGSPSLPRAVARLRRAGLGVVVALAPPNWALETSATDRAALHAIWARLAPTLRDIDQTGVFPEILNEPVFTQNPSVWAALQTQILGGIRAAWPEATIILTGANWGSIDGLLALPPPTDGNVVYTIHFYEPAVLTALGAFEPALDRAALAALPFPAVAGCAVPTADPRSKAVAAYYCAQGWNAQMLTRRLALAAGWAQRHNAAILVGEFGASATLNAESRLAWLAASRRAFDGQKFGWALWGYDDIMGFNLPRPPPQHPVLDPGLRAALGLVSQAPPRL